MKPNTNADQGGLSVVGEVSYVPSKAVVEQILATSSADWTTLLEFARKPAPLQYPDWLINAIQNLNLRDYPRLYEHELGGCYFIFSGFLSDHELSELGTEWDEASEVDRLQWLSEMDAEISSCIGLSFPVRLSHAEKIRATREFRQMSDDKQREALRQARHFYGGSLAIFHQGLAALVHGQSMTSLLRLARAGDPEAISKLSHIDRRTLAAFPEIQHMIDDARARGDKEFVRICTSREHTPQLCGQKKRNTIHFALSILDTLGVLDAWSNKDMQDVLLDAGVDTISSALIDEGQFNKIVGDYRGSRIRNESQRS